MNELMKMLLSLSLSGTLLLLCIFSLKQVYGNRFSKCWQYYIWLAVALRFLLPFAPDNTLVGLIFEAADSAVISEADVEINNDNVIKTDNEATIGIPSVQNSALDVANDNTLQQRMDVGVYLFFLWATLALVLLIRKITIYQSFLRYLKAANQEVSDIEVLNILSDCEEALHIKKTVELYQNPLIGSPMIIGFFRPSIILPVREAEEEKLSYIFNHELIHLKRWDIVYKWYIQIVVCVHWFNPFVYLLGKEVSKACELSCDEAVISSLDDRAKKAYGDTLLLFLKTEDAYKNSLVSVTLTEGAKQLKERLGAIMSFKKKSKTIKAMTVILTIVICLCFQTLGVYAKQGKTQNPAQPKELEDKVSYDSILYDEDNNAYYILCDGADWIDMPSCSFSDGTIGIVLVKKDRYHSLGPFSGTEKLVEEVSRQLQYGVGNGYETQAEADMILKVAEEIQNSTLTLPEKLPYYTYTQNGYYQKPYVIEMGWNLSTKEQNPDYSHAEITLKDNSNMTVWFSDSAKKYINNQEALLAISALLQSINAQNPYQSIEMPVIMKMTFVDENELEDYAKECFVNNDLIGFSAVFSALDKALQTYYYERVYDNDKIAFFATVVQNMEQELLAQYADKAYKEGRVNFFAVILDHMDDMGEGNIDGYAQKAYDENDIAAFSIVTSHMTEEAKQEWLLKAQNDKKFTFCMVLSD